MILLPLMTVAGIDVGHAVDNAHANTSDVGIVADVGVGWVRINIIDESVPLGIYPFLAGYDEVVDAYLARGFEVYALINDEALRAGDPLGSDAWIAKYVARATEIVEHFKGRIRFYEIINEPNDYAGGTTARFTPAQFAKILEDTHRAIKLDHPGDRCWDVDLISGPLFSFDGNSSANYLQQTFALASPDVVDGIGYHMYVAQGTDSSTADVRTQMLANLSAIDAVTGKPIWVSEYGWEASVVGETLQAERLTAGYDAMLEQGNVAAAFYFNLHDFPGATYGAYERPASAALRAIGGVPLRAELLEVTAPQNVAPDSQLDVVVRVKNLGTETWLPETFRLAAAPGCPESSTTNEITWEPVEGYANSLTDARVLLTSPVPPGSIAEVHVRVRAPASPVIGTFAARMVHEGDRFFGPTIKMQIFVDDRGDDSLPPIDPARGCGCASTGDPSLLLGLFALRRRRRREKA